MWSVMRRRFCLNIAVRSSLSRSLSTKQEDAQTSGTLKARPYHEIPGRHPSLWPLNSAHLLLSPGGLSKTALKYFESRFKTYGPLYRDKTNPYFELLLIVNPKDAEVLLRSESKYPQRMIPFPLEEFREKRQKPAGVFFADGEEWYKHRSVISKRMLRPKEMSEYSVDLNQIADDFIKFIRQVREPAGSKHEFEVKDLDNALFRWSFEGVNKFVFDRRFGALQEPMTDLRGQSFINSIQGFLDTFIDVQLVPMPLLKYYETRTYKRFKNSISNMYFHVESFLDEAVKDMKLDEVVGMKHTEVKTGRLEFLKYLLLSGKLGIEDLVASVVDLMLAGVDTTSNTIHWCLYLLGKNPEKLKKLEEEIHAVLKCGELADLENLQHAPYLKAVIKETLRLYPVVTQLPRKVPWDITLSGYHVPAGTQVFVDFFHMSRDPKLFSDPTSFIPERWLDETPELAKFASLPFGFGVRMCVGRRLAELEMHLLLARLIQEFKIVYTSEEDIPIRQRGVPIPEKNVPVKFVDR